MELLQDILEPLSSHVDAKPNFKLAAVLVPIFKEDNKILFTLRTQIVSHHKGQVSFPGGSYDAKDGNILETAYRETKEEVGICKDNITMIGRLSPMSTISNYYVIPFVGLIDKGTQVKANNLEVEHYFFATISYLMNPENILIGKFDGMRLPYYSCSNYKIWGVTGMILSDLLNRLREHSSS
ncbi:MAG: NUDIX hydrolase [Candidatus Thorarchaeota archaeon]